MSTSKERKVKVLVSYRYLIDLIPTFGICDKTGKSLRSDTKLGNLGESPKDKKKPK